MSTTKIKQSPKGTPQIFHFNRMRAFKGECDSSWAMDMSKKIDKNTQTLHIIPNISLIFDTANFTLMGCNLEP